MSTRRPFAPVARQTLTDQVRERLVASIEHGELGPGDRLPAEDVLCRELGVSRPSVREAIRELMVLGLVERRGNRAHVAERMPDVHFDVARRIEQIRELFETRRAVEVPLTRYAATRASEERVAEIVELDRRIARVTTLEELRPLDQRLHAMIAGAAGNVLLAELHAKVASALFESTRFAELMTTAHPPAETRRILDEVALGHSAITEAIAAGDGDRAAAAATAHLDEVEARLIARTT
ncbi:MAG: GntR family transcriptional regulator [Actinomycetota bacterium]|nr:GntR family transcriptional regulator [Actinomycetota bacterium]